MAGGFPDSRRRLGVVLLLVGCFATGLTQAQTGPPPGKGKGGGVAALEARVAAIEAFLEGLPTGNGDAEIRDSLGTVVGTLLDIVPIGNQGYAEVLVRTSEGRYPLRLTRDGYLTQQYRVGFDRPGCTGIAYILLAFGPSPPTILAPTPLAEIGPPGETLYAEDGPVQLVAIESTYRIVGEQGLCESASVAQAAVVPARPVVDLGALFVPPFSLGE